MKKKEGKYSEKKSPKAIQDPARERRTVVTPPWFLPLPQKARVRIKRMPRQIFATQNANRDWRLHL